MSSMMTRSKNENTAKATNTHKYASTWLAVVFSLLFCFFSSLLFGAHSLSPQRSHFASLCLSSLDSFLCGWLFFADKIPRAIAYWDLPASYSTIAWLQFVHTKSIKSFDICICAFFSCLLFGCCFFLSLFASYNLWIYGVHQREDEIFSRLICFCAQRTT